MAKKTRKKQERPITPGDKVKFDSKKGVITGVVTNIRLKKSRKARKLLRGMNLPEEQFKDMTEKWVAEIAPDDGGGYWTVSVDCLTIVKRAAAKSIKKAHEHVQGIKNQRREVKAKKRSRNVGKVRERGLEDLKPGDSIEVNFKNKGWTARVFAKFSKGGRVGYYSIWNDNKIRYCYPDCVRIPEEEMVDA